MQAGLKNKLFMLRKLYSDVTRDRRIYELSNDLHSQQLGTYYFLFDEERVSRGRDQALISRFDEDGIPINRTYIDVIGVDYVYFPISIGQMGLAVFHTYLKSRSEEDKRRFLKFVDWFYHNAHRGQRLGVRWLTRVPLPQYQHPGPWQSAFAQSRGISILLRGHELTGDDKYVRMAEEALTSFRMPVPDGGVTSFTRWGPFYEEYPASAPTLVLNGMMFSLCGLYDFCRVFPGHTLAEQLFGEGVDTLCQILPEYDLGFWSRYNLCSAEWYPAIDPSTISYQNLHAIQLELLYNVTGNQVLKQYADIFFRQVKLRNIVRSILIKYRALEFLNRL